MKSIQVKSLRGNYSVLVGSGLLVRTGSLVRSQGAQGKVMIVTQEKIAVHYLSALKKSFQKQGLITFSHLAADGEEAKTEKELSRLYRALLNEDFERRDWLAALGGGTVGDLTGFAAASFLRGISWANVATTLLAQVDSAIGGKTGINLAEGKNLVGAFYPPRVVISDSSTLETLPAREYQAALGEVVKYGVIKDARLFEFLEKNCEAVLEKDPASLQKILEASSRIKAGVVSEDELETKGELASPAGGRMILNFGHTFAHGIEQALHYRKLFHGEAVAVGMVLATRLACKLKIISSEIERRLARLLEAFHLPISLNGFELEARDILSGMGHDKKKHSGKLRFVLPVRLGKVVVKTGISDKILRTILIELGARS